MLLTQVFSEHFSIYVGLILRLCTDSICMFSYYFCGGCCLHAWDYLRVLDYSVLRSLLGLVFRGIFSRQALISVLAMFAILFCGFSRARICPW